MTDIRALAHECGAVSYTPGPMRAVRGVSLTFEQLEAFAARVLAQAAAPEPWLDGALVVLGDIRKDLRTSAFGGLQCDELERQLRAAALTTQDGWVKVSERLPACDGETMFIGENEAGYIACFNSLTDDGYCFHESAESSICVMSGLRHWKKVELPAPPADGKEPA